MTILKINGVDVSEHLTKDGYKVAIQDVHSNESGDTENAETIVDIIWPDRSKIYCEWRDISPEYMATIVEAVSPKKNLVVEYLYGRNLHTAICYVGNRELTMAASKGELWNLTLNLINQKKGE